MIRAQRADLLATDRARLATALLDADRRRRFTMSTDPAMLRRAAAVIVCVPTPVDHFLVPDLTALRAACATVVENAVAGQTLVLTSTTYVGSTRDLLIDPLADLGFRAGADIFVAFSPERIDPGNDRHAHEDVPRVLGGVTSGCAERASALLGGYARTVHVVGSTDAAEMTKLLENTFRAVNIALVNEFADICRTMGMDVMDVIDAAATKPYGFMAFYPGPGVGGHCIPCDPHYLLWQLRRARLSTPVIEQAMAEIAARPSRVVARIRETLSGAGKGLPGARVLVVGIAYKPDVEDLRESPALEIMAGLIAAGATVAYHDPYFPSAMLDDGSTVIGVSDPAGFDADLVLIHTVHASVEMSWVTRHPLVLDATYRMTDVPSRVSL